MFRSFWPRARGSAAVDVTKMGTRGTTVGRAEADIVVIARVAEAVAPVAEAAQVGAVAPAAEAAPVIARVAAAAVPVGAAAPVERGADAPERVTVDPHTVSDLSSRPRPCTAMRCWRRSVLSRSP